MKLLKVWIPVMVCASFWVISGCRNKAEKPSVEKSEELPASPQEAAQMAIVEQILRESALEGNTENVRQLLRTEPNVNSTDEDGRTALMYAAFNGHQEIVAALVEKGADVNIRDYMDRTALLYASTGNFPVTVLFLLKSGADPNIVDNDEHFTALMHAAAEGHIDVVKILLKNGADPHLHDIDGDNAESFARQNGHVEVADFIHSKL